ncbi:cytochrome c1 [Sphingosinithalassobacter sp. CS137]|uniref:cytochrome c1 n=1 Tax=Sphingosinithalassobacter sp. CS137 TaxID=2762748 RepID=UPI00165DADED|nr:cytochrome c1 [Sphingosinithalassobacter sp. CS137]
MSALFVKSIKFLIGLGFVGVLLLGMIGTIAGAINEPAEETVEHEFHEEPVSLDLASDGPFGHFDRQQLQRGFQVYREVCASCHSLRLASFRELEGIGYNEAEIKAIAAQWPIETPSINPDTGEATTRPNLASDRFPSPYANEVAARAANNNAVPPDLTLIAKARGGGSDYIYSLLIGYGDPSAELRHEFPEFTTPQGLYFNRFFPTLNIAMPPPLTSEGQVQYVDGTRPTVEQMARDVSAFLVWTAEPTLETRHQAGLASVIFLIIASFLAYGAYLTVWRGVKH